MKQNILLLFAMVLFCTANAYAQLGKDCTSAATICGTAQIPAPTAGSGDVTDNVPNDCGVSEHNSTWVTFVVTTAGTLTMNFNANPDDDIDFALWRIQGGGTIAASCAALTEVGTNDRCDYNASITESGFGTTCGTGSGCDTEGNLTVAVGDRIIAMVDDFGTFDGFAFTPTVGGTSQRACNTVKCNSCASPICTGSSVYANYAAASGDVSAGCNTDEIRIPGSQIQEFCMTFTTPATLTTNEIAFDAGVSRTPGTCGMAFTSGTLYSNACGAITSSGTDAASGYPKFPVAPSTTYKYCTTWTGTSCTQIQNPCFRPFYSPAPACVTPTAGITNNESPVSTVITCPNPGISVTATGGATYAWSGGSTPSTAANTFTSAGTYTVTVTAASGGTCTATTSITITGNTTAPTAGLSNNGPICSGATATLTATPATGATYLWSAGATAVAGTNTATATPATTTTYTVTVTDSANGCESNSTTSVTVTAPTTPTFAAIPAFCSGTTAPTLPASSTNTPAITGTWSPATINNTTGATYTFTPAAGQCATTATLTTTVTAPTTPTFAAIPAFCSGTTAPTLPTSSTNTPAITGTWNPATIDNTTGATYTFTPAAGQCATTATLTTTVTAPTTPTFAAIPAFCSGTTAPTLPTSSTNTPAITGTWNPATIDNTTGATYTFTPAAGQCATTATLTTTVTAPTTPTFAAIPAFCSGTTAPTLPTSSTNTPAITGTWSPSSVSNTASGTYTFTPNAGQCATTATVSVTVNALPTFTGVASCSGGANTGSVSQAATGGSGSGYTYTVTGGSFGPALTNGNYTVTVQDSNGCQGTGTVTVSCADVCPSLTAQAPAAVVSSQSTCSGCALSGGVVAAPATACPAGSTLQYSLDGTSWSSTLPTYNQTTAITIQTRCNCNVDNTQSSPTNTVTTAPGTCTTASATAGSNSPVACGGTINLTSTAGASYAWTGPGGYNSTAQNPTRTTANATMAGPYTVVVTAANGCASTSTATVVVGACTTTTLTLNLLDPCTCNNDATVSINGTPALPVADGTFSELVHTPAGAIPVGLVLNVEAVTGLTGVAVGDDFTYDAIDGWYEIPGTHVDNVGYTISVKLYEADGVTPFDGDPGTAGVQELTATIGNKCRYPNPDFSIGSFVDCNTAMALTTVHSAEGNGTAAYSGTGVSGTNFTPTGLTGAQTITLTYTGINDGNNGISPDGGTTAVFPGCQEVIQKPVTVNCPACQASPNMQWGN